MQFDPGEGMDLFLTPKVSGSSAAEWSDSRAEAARSRLRHCKNRRESCEVIREIIANLLGCEEMALIQVDAKHGVLWLIWSFGVEPNSARVMEKLWDPVWSLANDAEAHAKQAGSQPRILGHGPEVSALVPIHHQGATAGVLALLQLLPQKSRIDEIDHELFEVISREAGNALFGEDALTVVGERNQ